MRCPVCRAENPEGPNCRRCRADLSLLFALEERHAQLLREARRQAAAGDWPAAARQAEQAHALRRDAEAARLAAVAALMQGDPARALRWYADTATRGGQG